MKKTILIISNVTAGLVSFRSELIKKLKEEYDVIVLASDTGQIDKLDALGVTTIINTFDRHGTNPLTEIKCISYYKKQIEKIKPCIILTYTIKQNIYGGIAASITGVPYIANVTGLGPALEHAGFLKMITIPLYRFGLRKAQKVFFQNESNRDFMIMHHMVKRGRYDLLPGSGVNLEKYTVLSYPNNDTVDFVFISRIIKEKGIDEYIEAAKTIRKRHPETRFHVCGTCEGDYERQLNELDKKGIIIYHGRVDDIISIHKECACTVHPSYYPEGMSNVLLEACACGRPIITTDRPGCKEIVDDGVNGFLIRQKDSFDLSEKIEKFLQLGIAERRDMGLVGRRKVEKEFDRKIIIHKYLEEIRKVSKNEL